MFLLFKESVIVVSSLFKQSAIRTTFNFQRILSLLFKEYNLVMYCSSFTIYYTVYLYLYPTCCSVPSWMLPGTLRALT